ncbi:hypothetical protein TNCT_62751 [Trichonephila clavata]|uniref:Uncharacterized protein n=1 Tax=Trichonephila clavata TaxID=2740835 RepID=A0A8X6GX78_TRICU|nr:hypothetical protein TNCT_62751 [Trichonephila clavata]
MFIESEARALGLFSGSAEAPKKKLGTINQISDKSYAESRKNPLPRGILFGQWKGPLRGRVCGGRVACVAGDGFEVRYAENVLEVEGLGSGWLGSGDSFISRNPPWLRHWTVPGSTLWGFPRRLALKNPPMVPLGTLEKCGHSGSGGGLDGTGRNPCSQKYYDN